MMERLELALGRLREIPEEQLVPVPYRDYFRETAVFLLAVLENEDRSALWQSTLPGGYEHAYCNPGFAAARLGREMGQILSAMSAELTAIIPCAAAGDEAGMANLLELFLEIYGDFAGEELPSPGNVRTIFRFYAEDYLADQTAEQVWNRVCPGGPRPLPFEEEEDFDPEEAEAVPAGKGFRQMLEEADLTDSSYLCALGIRAGDENLALAGRYSAMSGEEIDALAEKALAPVRTMLSQKPVVKTVGLMACAGAERVLLAAARQLEGQGLAVTLPPVTARLSVRNDDIPSAHPEGIPNIAFCLDHAEDLALFLDENFVSRRKRAAREAYEACREEAAVFGGLYFLELSGDVADKSAEQVEACPEAIAFTDGQERLRRSLAKSLEEIRERYEA